jgi:4-diphosphocytidyl-2-C-methyl-D-erythritol kinase
MYPRKIGDAWEVLAPAKLNLFLEVLGKRADGFHELETLIAPIRLYDHLVWRPRDDRGNTAFSLRYSDATARTWQSAAPADRANLVWRAAEMLAADAGVKPHGEIVLTKRIPIQAGLGGGSSDAAAALTVANAAWKLNYSRERLASLGARLGSDVPFFFAGGSAICRGRGERVESLPPSAPLNVVVVAPPEGISTAEAFKALSASSQVRDSELTVQRHPGDLVQSLRSGSLRGLGDRMFNRLQSAAATLTPWVARLGTAFASVACDAHMLTGSGSAYFGVMRSARHARQVAAQLSSANLGTVFACATYR